MPVYTRRRLVLKYIASNKARVRDTCLLGIVIVTCSILLGVFSLGKASAQTPPDPGVPGPFQVTQTDYDFGDLAFGAPSHPNTRIEIRARVSIHPFCHSGKAHLFRLS